MSIELESVRWIVVGRRSLFDDCATMRRKTLIGCGADLSQRTSQASRVPRALIAQRHLLQKRRTILHESVKAGSQKAVRWLLEQSSTLHRVKDGQGDTPLHLAVRLGKLSIIEFLVSKAPSVTERGAVSNSMFVAVPQAIDRRTTLPRSIALGRLSLMRKRSATKRLLRRSSTCWKPLPTASRNSLTQAPAAPLRKAAKTMMATRR